MYIIKEWWRRKLVNLPLDYLTEVDQVDQAAGAEAAQVLASHVHRHLAPRQAADYAVGDGHRRVQLASCATDVTTSC